MTWIIGLPPKGSLKVDFQAAFCHPRPRFKL